MSTAPELRVVGNTTSREHVNMEGVGPLRPAELAEVYCRQVDELAAMVEAEQRRGSAVLSVLADALGELSVSLDEIATRLQDGTWTVLDG